MDRRGDILDWPTLAGKGLTQKGMQYRPRGGLSVFLMSRRPDAPYEDQLADDGQSLVYVGHDVKPEPGGPDPKSVDQPLARPDGRPSDNAKFLGLVDAFKGGAPAERVRVYDKLMPNVWADNGTFELVDAWAEREGTRSIFKFKLRLIDAPKTAAARLGHTRVIPSAVKYEVWKRDHGECVICHQKDNLHFDHELPFSKGGTSLLASNIRILCARHNLTKGDRIE